MSFDISKIENSILEEEDLFDDNKSDKFNLTIDLQRDLLNLILTDRNFLINSLSLVKQEYFEDIVHRIICQKCFEYFEKYNSPITLDLLIQEIKSKYSNHIQLPRILTEIDIISERTENAYKEKSYLEKEALSFAKQQAVKLAILKSVELLDQGKFDEIEKNIKEALLVAPEQSFGTDIFKDIKKVYQRLMAEYEGEKFTTGWPTIDKELCGGMGKKEIGMIFSNSGVGKSLWLCKVAAENLIRGKKVLYISCEMSEERIAMRIHSMLSLIPIDDIITNIPELERKMQIIESKVSGLLKIKEFPAGEGTINDFRAYTNKLYNHTGFQPDLILLDYIDEVKCSNSRLNTYEGQYHTTREFRGWMQAENLCGMTATQANRIGRQVRTITEGEIGDSYAKIRVVDCLWSLNETDEEKNKYLSRLFVVKHRNGKSKFTVWVKRDPDTLRMKEIDETEYESILGSSPPVSVCGEDEI